MKRQFPTPATKTCRYHPKKQFPLLGGPGRWEPQFFVPLGCAALCLLIVVPWIAHAAGAGGCGFDSVVSSIEHTYHVRATRIPCMGLASIVAGAVTNGGVGGVQVAEFEHFNKAADGEELNRMVEEELGQGWVRMIRSTTRHGGEQTLILARQEGKRMGLFILDLEGNEMDVVQVSVDPDNLNRTIARYDHRDGGKDESD
jgi:hypothetical protein